MTEYFEVQLTPKVVVGDHRFMSVELEAYYARHDIKPVGIGPDTPWPNRAEAAVYLTKHQMKLMLDGLINDSTCRKVHSPFVKMYTVGTRQTPRQKMTCQNTNVPMVRRQEDVSKVRLCQQALVLWLV